MDGIWIRTQNRKGLIYAKRIVIEQFKKFGTDEYWYRIINQVLYQDSADDYDLLGEYKTEERAIEIINQIQERISRREWIKHLQSIGQDHYSVLPPIVYEMPKE